MTAQSTTLPAARRRRFRHSRLTVGEVVEAAALADVAAAVCVLSRVLPVVGVAVLVASVAFGLLAARHRLRVALVAVATGVAVAFLFGGYGAAGVTSLSGVIGSLMGIAIRRRWSMPRVVGASVAFIAAPAAVFTVVIAGIFEDYRELIFAQFRNAWRGVTRIARLILGEDAPIASQTIVDTLLDHWLITLPAAAGVSVFVIVVAVYSVDRRLVRSLAGRLADAPLSPIGGADSAHHADSAPPAPVPLELRAVTHTHPGAPVPAIAGIDLVVRPGEFLVVAGDNGTGKSTLAAIIAGRAPTGGEAIRPGPLGYGQTGGTAVIGQRPETGVLGMRVADDVAWGARGVDPGMIDQLLSLVGLRGFADAETTTLSGGQLQRLAIASALVRRPALLVSDESTAMLDSAGRRDIMALYRRLASEYGTAVVHITHDRDEIAMADRVFVVRGNSAVPVGTPPPVPPVAIDRGAYRWGASVRVRDVSFAHDAGTPWQKPVFAGLSLSVAAGETVLVAGRNGAGKSTLARLLAGIEKPTGGSIFVDNEPPRNTRDGVLFGHQFARLGIVRGRVRSEICDSAGVDGSAADRAMLALGFDPWRDGDVRVDVLSGGQQRRVVLAGLLAARPRVLVLDEPLAGLDEPSRAAIVVALRQLKDFGTTIIIVTHDLDPFTGLADRTIELDDSREVVPAVSAPSRASFTSVVGRVLPNSSPARALWAGTKIAVLLMTAVMFAIRPGWTGVGVGVVIALVWTMAGRVPYAALPRVRWWFAAVALLGGVVTAFGGGEPYVTVAGVELGCGGAITWALMLTIAIVSLYLSLLLCWTTPMVEIPPLLQSITRSVSRLGISAEAPASAIAVALRFCPFMIGNLRILAQTISQRRSSRGQPVWAGLDAWFRCLGVACSLAVSDAQDLAQAMVNRGGIGRVAGHRARPGRWDAVVSVVVAASCGAVMIWG